MLLNTKEVNERDCMIIKTKGLYSASILQQQVEFIIEKAMGCNPRKYGVVVVGEWPSYSAFVAVMVKCGWSWVATKSLLKKDGCTSLYIVHISKVTVSLKGIKLCLAISLTDSLPSNELVEIVMRLTDIDEENRCVYQLQWFGVLRVIKLEVSQCLKELLS